MTEDLPQVSQAGVWQGRVFPETPWSLIVGSQQPGNPAALAALDRLARAYWQPLVVYARSSGRDADEAQDEVQRMFEHMLQRDSLKTVVPGVTRFRHFLIKCLRNTMVSSFRAETRRKRGGGVAHEPLDQAQGIAQTVHESPEIAMDRAWAAQVFEQAFALLSQGAQKRGRERQLAVLEPVLRGRVSPDGYAGLAAALETSEGTARKMIFDLRARLGLLIREQVALTVADPSEVEDELRHLISLL